jgi:hypothetical protein
MCGGLEEGFRSVSQRPTDCDSLRHWHHTGGPAAPAAVLNGSPAPAQPNWLETGAFPFSSLPRSSLDILRSQRQRQWRAREVTPCAASSAGGARESDPDIHAFPCFGLLMAGTKCPTIGADVRPTGGGAEDPEISRD